MKENDFITVLIYPPYSFYTYLHYNPAKEKKSYPAKVLGWSKLGAKHPYISISLLDTGRIMRIHPAQVQYYGLKV